MEKLQLKFKHGCYKNKNKKKKRGREKREKEIQIDRHRQTKRGWRKR